jgi:DNA mismatch endonuclease (patch repair protein)
MRPKTAFRFHPRTILMADIFSRTKRSQVMAAIKSKGNKDTELKLILIFRANEISGWRRNQRIFGKPDFVFRRERLAVFVDGCFWHGCKQHCRMPRDNRKYWREKILRNQKRDRLVTKTLRRTGWRVLRIWEHELKNETRLVSRVWNLLSGSE